MAEKLIRDNVPEMALFKGDLLKTRVADMEEMPDLLIRKLIEETMEFREKPSYEELADILEVVYGMADYLRVKEIGAETVLTEVDFVHAQVTGRERLEDARMAKKMLRGGFRLRLVLTDEKAECPTPRE